MTIGNPDSAFAVVFRKICDKMRIVLYTILILCHNVNENVKKWRER